ncbi:hypothetical protein KYK29_17695 [Shinella daejeonensis]|uniref:hypothetical protein n=1 Tax=Shinella daejeonensis TaxID=659017 RepID=UPI0020C817FF|nr:hypothetical protein [Shinella daejeonensis]MCP8896762.1 hypothetical protein [Shinella daejeonensis]
MLTQTAPAIGTTPSSTAVPVETTAGARSEPPAPAIAPAIALAGIRAEMLLRLFEALIGRMPEEGGRDNAAGRPLLEALIAALKSLPEAGDKGRRPLFELLVRLPPNLRPAAETLVRTLLSSMPTRTLMEAWRAPDTPKAQKLIALLSERLAAQGNREGEIAPAGARRPPATGLTIQQLAALDGRTGQQTANTQPAPSADARALQNALVRLFEMEGGRLQSSRFHSAPAGGEKAAPPTPARVSGQEPAARPTESGHAGERAPVAPRQDHATVAPVRNGTAEPALPAAKADRMQAADHPAERLPHTAPRLASQGALQQAVVRFIASLPPKDAQFLRLLLEKPLDMGGEPKARPMAGGPAAPLTGTGDAVERPARPAAKTPETASADLREMPAAARRDPVTTTQAVPLREGVPLAYVPYLPAEDDPDWDAVEDARNEEDEDPGGDTDDGGEPDDDERPDDAADATASESPDMAQRRRKTEEMVGTQEPGLSFYRTLGDYWA